MEVCQPDKVGLIFPEKAGGSRCRKGDEGECKEQGGGEMDIGSWRGGRLFSGVVGKVERVGCGSRVEIGEKNQAVEEC